MEPRTSKKDYRNHQYSGSRKSRKRVRGQMNRYHGEGKSRNEVWCKKPKLDDGAKKDDKANENDCLVPTIISTNSVLARRSTSTDTDRTRLLTPSPERSQHRPSAAHRVLMLSLVGQSGMREPEEDLRPPQRPKVQAWAFDATRGGSLCVKSASVDVMQTPGGHVQRASVNDVPLCFDVLEKVEALDVSEEEREELLKTAPWHDQRWVDGAGAMAHREYPSPCVSTGAKRASRPPSCDGSDLDDEFDLVLLETTTRALTKDIPDDEELEQPVRDIVNEIERGMDDEADRLLGMSSNFTWVQGFDSFRGTPEVFSGPTPGPVKDYDSPYDAFIDIWDKSIIELIVLQTNLYAKLTIEDLEAKGELKPSSRLREWTDTNVDEMMTLFAVFMYMGLDPRTTLKEYWTLGVLEMPRFRSLMSYNRYVLLNKFLHFVDNRQTGVSSSANPGFSQRLKKLAPILEHLGQTFFSLYNLGCNVSIDESLTLFKGLSWVQTVRSKAARFGIKSYELCESNTGYMARFQIYTGKTDCAPSDPSPSVDLGGKSTKVVLELLQGLEHRGHCVTMDNFYNCPSLARYLKNRGFDCLGTLRPSRRHVPSEIGKVPQNVAKGTIISRQCGDLSIVTWKDSKLVNMISTYHDDGTFVETKAGKPLIKPKCVRDYNNTMGAIDLKDQKLSMYLLERKRGMKWYVKMFKRLLNVSIQNALIMYVSSLKRRDKLAVTHREFRYTLADSLVRRHANCQPEVSRPVGELTRLRRDICHVPKYESGRNNRKRCAVCVRLGVNKMVHSQCVTCEVFLCFEDCWTKWHSSHNLKGREVLTRKSRREKIKNGCV